MQNIKIDIVSDIMCPWCAIGYFSLTKALEALAGQVNADISWQPFELNPAMPAEGQNLREHLMEKYGINAEQSEENRAMITARGAAVGFSFNFTDDMRMHNTFKAHQLLHWAKTQTPVAQTELKKSLFTAYFTQHLDINDEAVLLNIVSELGLDSSEAQAVLADERFAMAVRGLEQQWQEVGIHSVPAFIFNNKYLVSGGQPPAAFVQTITEILAETAVKP